MLGNGKAYVPLMTSVWVLVWAMWKEYICNLYYQTVQLSSSQGISQVYM